MTTTLYLDASVTIREASGTTITQDSMSAATKVLEQMAASQRRRQLTAAVLETDQERIPFENTHWMISTEGLVPSEAASNQAPDITLIFENWTLTTDEGKQKIPSYGAATEIAQKLATDSSLPTRLASTSLPVNSTDYEPAPGESELAEPVDRPVSPAKRTDPEVSQPEVTGASSTDDVAAGDSMDSAALQFATRAQNRSLMAGPAELGVRGALNNAFSTKLAPGKKELITRNLRASTQRGLAGHRTATVLNIKGGVGKTTVTFLLGATLGRVRGGNVVAWDNNENSGNLSDRAMPANHSHTALDLLQHIEDFRSPENADKLVGYVRPQGENRFHVLASQNEAGDSEVIDGAAFQKMHEVLRQFYHLALVDTGNASTASTWQASVNLADVLVIVTSNKEDNARRAFTTIDALIRQGHREKLANGVAIVTEPHNSNPERLKQIIATMSPYVRKIIVIPFDKALDEGGEIVYESLAPRTQEAFLMAGAAVVEGM